MHTRSTISTDQCNAVLISKSSIEMKFVVIVKSRRGEIYPSPSRDRVRVSRKFKRNQSDLHRWKKRGGEKEGSIELWNRKCCIPSKEYRDRMISVFEVTLENWKPIFKLESLTFRQLLYLHFHPFYLPLPSFPVATNRNLFKQAVRLTGSLLRRRFAGKLQFPAWNLPEIIS